MFQSEKKENFRQALAMALSEYGADYMESYNNLAENSYDIGFLEILKLCDYKSYVNETIDNIRRESPNWKLSLKKKIDYYKSRLADSTDSYAYNAVQDGYNSSLSQDNVFIDINCTLSNGNRVSDFFPIREYFLGAEIAYFLPILEDELKMLENQPLSNPAPQQNEMQETANQIQSGVDKINWQGEEASLAFLFKLLFDNGLIKEREIYSIISKHFTAKGKEIQRKNIKANYSSAKYHDLAYNNLPNDAKTIDRIYSRLADLENLLKEMRSW